MANEETYLKLLALRDIKPTANRLLVLREMLAADRAFSGSADASSATRR